MLVNPGDDSILRVGLFFGMWNYIGPCFTDMFMAAVNHRFFMPGYDMALQTVR